MSEPDCQYCGAKFSHHRGNSERTAWKCGTWWDDVDQAGVQSPMCHLAQLEAIVEAAWKVRSEEADYSPSPDLALRATYRKELSRLLDAWKAAEPAETT